MRYYFNLREKETEDQRDKITTSRSQTVDSWERKKSKPLVFACFVHGLCKGPVKP